MSAPDSENRPPAIAANGEDLLRQVETVERELRIVHAKLDQILCSVESLACSPWVEGTVATTLRDAVEPAAQAIHTGAGLLLERVQGLRSVSGW